jgi:hypothetical protein
MRKWPGKICRRTAVSPIVVKPQQNMSPANVQQYQSIASETRHGMTLA